MVTLYVSPSGMWIKMIIACRTSSAALLHFAALFLSRPSCPGPARAASILPQATAQPRHMPAAVSELEKSWQTPFILKLLPK